MGRNRTGVVLGKRNRRKGKVRCEDAEYPLCRNTPHVAILERDKKEIIIFKKKNYRS